MLSGVEPVPLCARRFGSARHIRGLITKFSMNNHTGRSRRTLNKLFVYGTLQYSHNFQLLTGRTLPGEDAVLYSHRSIHPKSGYPFALPWKGSKIEGTLIYEVTPEILEKLDEYESEGELYIREPVTVYAGEEPVHAYVYIGIPEALKPYFRKGIGMRDRIEAHIEKCVNTHLEEKAARYMRYNHEDGLPLQVTRELLSEETHSLVREYFREAGLPVFIIKHELEKANIPTLDWVKYEPKAAQYADEYIKLAVKFMIFNQIEERFRREFRPRVKTSDKYYRHTISAMMTLKLLVSQYQNLELAMLQLGVDRYDPAFSYVDYTVAAIYIAQELYTEDRAKEIAHWIRMNRRTAMTPLGAELEFSNIGGRAVEAEEDEDSKFDSFYYFYDFDLMRRGWKLGAHVDDHGFLTTTQIRTRGFLELAFGRYKLLGDVSKPATNDPWVLACLIDLTIRYIGIRPHSLHISLQTEETASFQKIGDPDYLCCLLLLGGDRRQDQEGKFRETRIYHKEIISRDGKLCFSRLNRHHSSPDDRSENVVVEYQFSRLYRDYDYQPLIMALKGFQMEANPYPLKIYQGCPYGEFHREIEDTLVRWAARPTPISRQTLDAFLTIVEKGLDTEAREFGPKYGKYVQRILGSIEEQLHRRNQRITCYHAYS